MRKLRWALAFGLCGCFLTNTSPAKKIGDSVHNLNEQTRWGRISDASLLVEPSYREAFVNQHQSWGSEIQLADSEILNVQIAPGNEHANALITYSWYAMDSMTLHETTVRQRWAALGGNYALVSETVVKGDARLLQATATADKPNASTGDLSRAP